MSTVHSWRFPAPRVLTGERPPAARTVGALLDEIAARHPDTEAVVHGRVRLTYSELATRTIDVARHILSLGVSRHDRVAIFMGNRAEWLLVWLAVERLGAVAVGISTWSTAHELAYLLRHSDARILFHSASVGGRKLGAVVKDALHSAGWQDGKLTPEFPCLRHVAQVDEIDDLTSGADAIDPQVVAALGEEVQPSDVALLLYTSGSTSAPKGVQLVHRGLVENGYDIGEALRLRPGDRYWLPLPLFWSAGSANTAMTALTHGATLVLQEHFEAEEAVRLLIDERCTHYFAFPNITRAVSAALHGRQLPAARTAVTSGQPETLAQLRAMGFELLLHPYGTTEDYGFATINNPVCDPEELTWSQGRALPGMELKAIGTDGEPVREGEPGELCIRGNVTPGYYKDDDLSRETFDDDGWFHTGDQVRLHGDGRLQFLGRVKELIKSAGFNIAPAEVEATLNAHPAVREAHVVGAPDRARGEVVVAFVSLAEPVDEEALIAHCRDRLSSYKVPHRLMFVDEFPMTATGKVAKRALAERAASEAAHA